MRKLLIQAIRHLVIIVQMVREQQIGGIKPTQRRCMFIRPRDRQFDTQCLDKTTVRQQQLTKYVRTM